MFIKKNIKAIILVLFVILSEVIYLPFSEYSYGVINGTKYNWGDVVYGFISQFGYVNFFPSFVLFSTTKNIDSKGIYLGLLVWNLIEMVQEFNLLFRLNITFLIKCSSTQSDILQIIFIFITVILSYIGFKKWST